MATLRTEPSHLIETAHGQARRIESGALRLEFGSHRCTLRPSELRAFKQSLTQLAETVYHRDLPCRWQVRLQTASDQPVWVLNSTEVLQLHGLVDGAVTMLELDEILEQASIGRPPEAGREERRAG